jgi:ribosomal protein S18 acetylase RimI-like enzyme
VIQTMKPTFKYQPFQVGQERIVSELVWEVFAEFEAPEYSDEGINTFKEFIKPEALRQRVTNGDYQIYCCFNEAELVGVLALRDRTHISLLFVKKNYHRQGIAKELLRLALEELQKSGSQVESITVNSSPYAVKIYERLGFIATDTMQEKDGIKYTPMKKIIIYYN